MSEGLEKLRSIGAQKIHEQTHIAHRYVQDILHESFEGMQRVQLMGFISILEREYDVDLTPLRESGAVYFESIEASLPKEEASYKKELLSSSRQNNRKLYVVIVLVVLVGIGLSLYLFSAKKDETVSNPMPPKAVVQTTPTPRVSAVENNESNETVQKPKKQAVSAPQQKAIEHHSLSIVPRTKVWLGIIDLDTGKKRQTVTSRAIELNATKSYLLTFGHGYIDIEVDGNKTSFKDPKAIKFLYKEGTLQKIDNTEFRRYNKGKLW